MAATTSVAIDLRNRLLVLLARRVSQVRSAARYVFRKHPDVVRMVTSQYERRKRLDARRRTKVPTPATA